jgi:hypothetical protein
MAVGRLLLVGLARVRRLLAVSSWDFWGLVEQVIEDAKEIVHYLEHDRCLGVEVGVVIPLAVLAKKLLSA